MLVAGEDPGVHQDLEMVRDGGLSQAHGLGKLADAGFAAFMRGDHRDQPEPGRVGQGLEEPGQICGLGGADRLAQQRGAADFGGGGTAGLNIEGLCAHLASMG